MRNRAAAARHHVRGSELSVEVACPAHSTSKGSFEPERCAIATHRVNVLIQGRSPFIADTLALLRRDFNYREFIWPELPIAGSMASATVLVHEIGALSRHALDALAQLIAVMHPRVQMIVTSSVALHELVERGQFPADLYYRLNVVMLTDDEDGPLGETPAS